MSAPVEIPQWYACIINNQNDHTGWTAGLADLHIVQFMYADMVPATWIESTDPELLVLGPQLPMGQCCGVGDRHQMLMSWVDCRDIFRAHVRPDLLQTAHTLATTGGSLAELQAAVVALCDEAGYPAPGA